jgi:hypothetical protein
MVGTGIHAAEPPTVEPVAVLDLELRGVGQLRFGEHFEWQLVIEPPAEVRSGEGIRLGAVAIVGAGVRHVLPEPAAYSFAENGGRCGVHRVGHYAILRCSRDYVFDLRAGTAPIPLTAQFGDRSDAAPIWLLEMPLPWWRPTGAMLGSSLLFLEYGYTNYGQAIETTEIYRGPALLDLATGKLTLARSGAAPDSPFYDASAVGEGESIALYPEALTGDRRVEGRRVVTVMTVFDRCVAAICRSDAEPGARRLEPLTYVFE